MKPSGIFSISFALALSITCHAQAAPAVVETSDLPAPEAGQAAAADDHFVYAIDSAVIAKYDRASGKRIATSTGPAKHLNSGFLWQGKVYCAHSNFPRKPEKSEIMVLDPESMALTVFKDFGESNGSLTWAIHDGSHWWCTFAFYGKENGKTRLVEFDEQWREMHVWTYPEVVVKELGNYSISGGIWMNGQLLVTGHDRRSIYRLRIPSNGTVLEWIETIPSPFPGQGIAADSTPGGILGIDRGKKQVIFAKLQE